MLFWGVGCDSEDRDRIEVMVYLVVNGRGFFGLSNVSTRDRVPRDR